MLYYTLIYVVYSYFGKGRLTSPCSHFCTTCSGTPVGPRPFVRIVHVQELSCPEKCGKMCGAL